MIGARKGKAIRFPHDIVRPIGRTATGVKGINLDNDDEVIGMVTVDETQDVMVVSENGYGKRSSIEDYRITNRGGKGVKTINITEKTGYLVAIGAVTDNDHLMIINKSGIHHTVDTLSKRFQRCGDLLLLEILNSFCCKIKDGADQEKMAIVIVKNRRKQ